MRCLRLAAPARQVPDAERDLEQEQRTLLDSSETCPLTPIRSVLPVRSPMSSTLESRPG